MKSSFAGCATHQQPTSRCRRAPTACQQNPVACSRLAATSSNAAGRLRRRRSSAGMRTQREGLFVSGQIVIQRKRYVHETPKPEQRQYRVRSSAKWLKQPRRAR